MTFGSASSSLPADFVQLVEDDGRAVLAAADPAAELSSLAVGEPAIEGIAPGAARQGEEDDIDAAVGALGRGIDRLGIGLPGPGRIQGRPRLRGQR